MEPPPSLVRIACVAVIMLLQMHPVANVNASADDAWWSPPPGLSWQVQLSDPQLDTALDVDVLDLDGWETDAETVRQIHARGGRAICYIDVGTREDWRPDADLYPAELVGNTWAEWDGERYVDIRRRDLLAPIIESRFDMCRDKGFDAIDPDNIDTYGNSEATTGFALTESDQLEFNMWIADEAHERGLAIGQKNVPELTDQLVASFDFAVTEDCFVDGWCTGMLPYIEQGKAVFAIEYTDVGADLDIICPEASTAGISVVLKHRDLDAWRESCGDLATAG